MDTVQQLETGCTSLHLCVFWFGLEAIVRPHPEDGTSEMDRPEKILSLYLGDAVKSRFTSTHRLLRLVSAEIPCGIEPLRRVLEALLKDQHIRGMHLQRIDRPLP